LLCDTDRALGLAYRACEDASDGYARRITYVISPEGKIERAIETSDPARQASDLFNKI
jgi:peroxiredoxin Q/BCP